MAPPSKASRAELIVSSALLLVLVAGCAAVAIHDVRALLPPCPFRALTGLYCPGCGSTRALDALLHGDVTRAFDMNPLGLLLAPVLGYVLVRDALELLGLARLPRIPLTPKIVVGLVVLVFAYWVLRNVPVYPFTLLAP